MMKQVAILLALVACATAVPVPELEEEREYSLGMNPRLIVEDGLRIFGGNDSVPGDFPHQVSIQLEISTNTTTFHLHNCGGIILSELWILTAGHCVVGIPNYKDFLLVVAGEWDFKTDQGTEQSAHVVEIIVHPLYPDLPLVAPNDIALIKLDTPLVFNEFVKPIDLPVADSIPSGDSILSGWGAVGGSIIFPQMPSILQTVGMPIINYTLCEELYLGSPLEETNVCTGPLEGGISACSGDSGGPLIQEHEDGSREVIGIVSWGTAPCGLPDSPSVYTRVSAFIDWINDSIANSTTVENFNH